MTIRRVKVLAAASLLALGAVPLFASSAAAEVESEAEIFQLVDVDDIDQIADARSGQNDAWNEIDHDDNANGTNVANNNLADIDAGGSSALNVLKEIDIFLWAQQWATQETTGFSEGDVESEAEIAQIVAVDIFQHADARSGQNDAWNNIDQTGNAEGENTANDNTAVITTGDSEAKNILEHLHINQHAENTADQTTTEVPLLVEALD